MWPCTLHSQWHNQPGSALRWLGRPVLAGRHRIFSPLQRANGKGYWVVILLSSLLPHRHSPRMHPLKRAGPGAERAADGSSGSKRDCQSLSFHCPGHDHGLCPTSPSSACHSKKIGEVLICLGINIIVFAVRHLASREDRFCWGHVSASNHLTFPSRSTVF